MEFYMMPATEREVGIILQLRRLEAEAKDRQADADRESTNQDLAARCEPDLDREKCDSPSPSPREGRAQRGEGSPATASPEAQRGDGSQGSAHPCDECDRPYSPDDCCEALEDFAKAYADIADYIGDRKMFFHNNHGMPDSVRAQFVAVHAELTSLAAYMACRLSQLIPSDEA